MAYDRDDGRDQNRGNRDGRGREGSRGTGDDRGFLDRARDELTSWFGDDESESRSHQDDRSGHPDSSRRYESREDSQRRGYQPQSQSSTQGFGHNRPDHDDDRSTRFGGGQSSSYGRGRDEGDYRNQYGRGGGESGGFGGGNYGHQNERQPGRSSSSSYGQPGGGGSYRPSEQRPSGSDDRSSYGRQSQGGDRYRPMTGDYDQGSGSQQRAGSGMGGQDFSHQQYGQQDRFQDQQRDSRRDTGRSAFGGSSGQYRSPHDEHYSSWRQRQIEDLDRDYDEYCREHQSRFENEFSGFRTQRQTKRQMLQAIREHFEVVDESGQHIGTVDKVRGDKIIMTRNDPEAHGVHRSFTCSLLERVEGNTVYLSGSKDMIRSRLTEEGEGDQKSSGGGFLGSLFGSSDNDRREAQPSSNQPSSNQPQGSNPSTPEHSGDGPHILDRSFSGTYDDDNSGGTKRG